MIQNTVNTQNLVTQTPWLFTAGNLSRALTLPAKEDEQDLIRFRQIFIHVFL